LKSQTWQIRQLTRVFPVDDIRNQRTYKILPHRFLPEFDQSLYIDNGVLLKPPAEAIFATADLSSGMALPAHGFRKSLLEEFSVVAEHGLDDPSRIAEQLRHYTAEYGDVLAQKPFWNGFLIRDHRNATVTRAMEIWLAHVYRYARRDQLSAPVAFHQAGLVPAVLRIDNYESDFHTWPNFPDRKVEKRLWTKVDPGAAELLSLKAEILALEHQLATLRREHETVLNATTWRWLNPMRAFARRLQGVVTGINK